MREVMKKICSILLDKSSNNANSNISISNVINVKPPYLPESDEKKRLSTPSIKRSLADRSTKDNDYYANLITIMTIEKNPNSKLQYRENVKK